MDLDYLIYIFCKMKSYSWPCLVIQESSLLGLIANSSLFPSTFSLTQT